MQETIQSNTPSKAKMPGPTRGRSRKSKMDQQDRMRLINAREMSNPQTTSKDMDKFYREKATKTVKELEAIKVDLKESKEELAELKVKVGKEVNESQLDLHASTIAKFTSCDMEGKPSDDWHKNRRALGTILLKPLKNSIQPYMEHETFDHVKVTTNYKKFSNRLSNVLRHGQKGFYKGCVSENGIGSKVVSVGKNTVTLFSNKSYYINPVVDDEKKLENDTEYAVNKVCKKLGFKTKSLEKN